MVNDIASDERLLPWREGLLARGSRAAAAFPLREADQTVGVLTVSAAEAQAFDAEVVGLLERLAANLSLALAAIAREEQLHVQKVLIESKSEASPDGIMVISRDERILFFNRRMATMWGFSDTVRVGDARDAAIRVMLQNVTDPQRFLERSAYLYTHPGEEAYDEFTLKDGRIFERFSAPVKGPDGTIYGRVWYWRDITERKRAEEERALLIREQAARAEAEAAQRRLAFLAEASKRLAASLDYEATLRLVTELAVPALADWCAVYTLSDDGTLRRLALAHGDPAKAELAQELVRTGAPVTTRPSIIDEAVRTGASRLVAEVSDALVDANVQDAEQRRLIRALRPQSAMAVPIIAQGRTSGALVLATAESQRRYGPADLALAEDLASCVGLAIDNARLYAAEREARQAAELAGERVARLQIVTAALSEAVTPGQAAEVVVGQGVASLGAAAGAVVTTHGDELAILRAVGYSPDTLARWQRFPLSAPVPLAETVRSGSPIWLESHAELAQRFPSLAGEVWPAHGAWVALPLLVKGRVIGGIALSFATARTFLTEDRVFMLA